MMNLIFNDTSLKVCTYDQVLAVSSSFDLVNERQLIKESPFFRNCHVRIPLFVYLLLHTQSILVGQWVFEWLQSKWLWISSCEHVVAVLSWCWGRPWCQQWCWTKSGRLLRGTTILSHVMSVSNVSMFLKTNKHPKHKNWETFFLCVIISYLLLLKLIWTLFCTVLIWVKHLKCLRP